MHTITTKNQFIELRSQGLTLDTISEQIGVPKPTLGRWHHECLEQIQRLRAVQWDLLEDQIGHRLEDVLERIAERIQKYEEGLDERVPRHMKPIDVLRVIRHSRREYLELRALLLAPLRPARGRTPCLDSLDPQKRDKTRQTTESLDTTSLPQNDLQQMETFLSHSLTPALTPGGATSEAIVTPDLRANASVKTELNSRGLISSQPSTDPNPSSADAVQNSPNASSAPSAESAESVVGPAPSPSATSSSATDSQASDSAALHSQRLRLLSVLQLRAKSGIPNSGGASSVKPQTPVAPKSDEGGSPQPSADPNRSPIIDNRLPNPSSAHAVHDSSAAGDGRDGAPSPSAALAGQSHLPTFAPAPLQSPPCSPPTPSD